MSAAPVSVNQAEGARALLDRPAPADYIQHWTHHHAQVSSRVAAQSQSAIVFRVGMEWFALETELCVEAASIRSIHSLPHRPRGAVLGIANVRGELVVCISLAAILRIEANSESPRQLSASPDRLLVASWPDGLIAFPVAEVHGIHRFRPDEIRAAPATIAQSPSTFSKGLLVFGQRIAGLLDAAALKRAIDRSLA